EDDDLPYDEQTTPTFERLRQLMFNEAPFRGAWYTAVMTITHDGKFDTEFDYDNKPSFEYTSEDGEYAQDFEHFPRNEESTPDWLRLIVQQHGLKYHIPELLG
ncbi:MAG TPA: immunity protein YezG family protein, partial [Hymenobacter sp.]